MELASRDEAAFCGPVHAELFGGFRSEATRREQIERFAEYPWIDTPRSAFELATEWLATVRGLGTVDALIAATAKVNYASLLSLDRDFDALVPFGLKLIPVKR